MVVFVQFKDEPDDPRDTWQSNKKPTYLGKMIATRKDTVGDWWNWYDSQNEILSSHWAEISRGKFHVISPVANPEDTGAFSVVLSKTGQEYFEFYNYDKVKTDSSIRREIWDSIHAQGLTDWRPYDRWKKVGSLSYFTNIGQGDSLVDMIYQVFKTRGGANVIDSLGIPSTLFQNNDGYNKLGSHYYGIDIVDNFGTKIDYSETNDGSGITLSFRGQMAQYIGAMGHEHGHLSYSPAHSTYSRVSYGFGFDNFSPADMILNGYMSPTNATFSATNYLGDFSSRISGNGNLLKIPIQNNEYFLIASRNKVSKWDRVMGGDTAQINNYEDYSDYGKGLYIYHIPNGLDFPYSDISQQDLECADGLFEWEYVGQGAQQVIHDCFISGATVWPFYKKKKVIYENDSSNLFRNCITSGYTPRPIGDGISLRYYVGCVNFEPILHYKWWGEGQPPSNSCEIGTDRQFTNYESIYSRFDIGGDRYDAWKPGYNEVFSPYSSPNTNTWGNQNSGIFIWLYLYSGSGPTGVAYIKVYKQGSLTGELPLDSILHLTPPSRPMGLKLELYESPNSDNCYSKLTWNHNMEPDMVRSGDVKKYLVYGAKDTSMSIVPTNYILKAAVEIHKDSTASYIDMSVSPFGCQPGSGGKYPARFYVKAVDKFEDVSVASDFVSTAGRTGNFFEEPPVDRPVNNEIPADYNIYQNYPNPFNSITKIKYDLPFDGFVNIKVYDINGKLMLTLVNENKTAGRYQIEFRGENLSSGVYYYKIESGNFSSVRKMLLIK